MRCGRTAGRSPTSASSFGHGRCRAQPEGSHHFGSRAGTRSRRAARARQAGDNAARVAGRTFTQHPHSDLACRHVRALAALDDRIAAFDAEFAAAARIDDAARRLMTVPGRRLKCDGSCRGGWRCTHLHWGPRSCRWLGIVPRRASTGGKPRLLGITKRGSKYLRKMLIQGGRTPDRETTPYHRERAFVLSSVMFSNGRTQYGARAVRNTSVTGTNFNKGSEP